MYYFVRSRSALAFVCALACLFFFYATSTPLRRVAAQEERRADVRRRPAQRELSHVPAALRAAIEKTRANERRGARLEADGGAAQPPLAIDHFNQQQRLQASGPTSGDLFSRAGSVNGEMIFVGAQENDNGGTDAGSGYVFFKGADVWGQQEQLQPQEVGAGDGFGYSVAISGDTAVVVAVGDDDNGLPFGSAYIFTRCVGVWSQQQRLQVFDATGSPYGMAFQSVAVSGNTAIFGAPAAENSAGAAYVFTRRAGVWTEQQRLKASDATASPIPGDATNGDLFGRSVSISGDTAIVGAHEDDNSGGTDAGSAYVFTRSNGVWTEQQRLQASDGTAQDVFGWSVSISGETAIVGAYQDRTSTGLHFGSAYIFQRSNGVWTQQQWLQPSGPPGSNTRFGYSVAISGETAIVGASAADTGGLPATGAAYIFHRSGGVWIEQQRLQASDAAANDFFGVSVAIGGDNAVVGAFVDDNSGGQDAGSAYVYTRSAGVWHEQRRLQASDAAFQDTFGNSVSISGETVIVGAFAHDSGSQDTGAAYIFGTPPPASPVLISEFRLAGPGIGGAGAGTDEFVELYNNTDAAITVGTTDGSAGWTLRSSDATLNLTIPNGDVISARGHYLVVNSLGYSLAPYPTSQHACPGGNCAYGNRTFTSDTPLNTGLALFRTAHPANFTHANRLDAAGPSTEADALYREGEGYAPVAGNAAAVQHSLVRNLLSGTPRDCDDRDFQLVATNGAATLHGALLGAPGPQNTDSPIQRNAAIKASLIDGTQPSFAPPNRVRDGAADPSEPANSTRGTLKIRRKFTNTTGAEVTRLRFRVVDITTTPGSNSATADLRVLRSSGGVNLMLSNGLSVPLIALTREEPPAQSTDGGGYNTTLSATLAQAIPHGASIYVEFNLGVVEDGNFSFRVNVEALTGAPASTHANSKTNLLRKPPKSSKAGALRPPTP